MDCKELISSDKDLYSRARRLNLILGIGTKKVGWYLILCTFLRLKEGVEYSILFKEVAQMTEKQKATVYSVIRNAIKRIQENSVPGLFDELVKFKDKSTPIDFAIDYIDFLQKFDFVQERDENGVSHAYYLSKTDGHRIPTLN